MNPPKKFRITSYNVCYTKLLREAGAYDAVGQNPQGLPHPLAEERLPRPEVAGERNHIARHQGTPERPGDKTRVLLAGRQKRNFHAGSPRNNFV